MVSLRHLVLTAGRALALLAALVLAIVPAALPAHAHLHGSDPVAVSAAHHHHATEASTDRSAEHDHGSPQHAGDCCFVCHVSVIPAVSAVPLPAASPRARIRSRERAAAPDAPAEILPEPPRSTA